MHAYSIHVLTVYPLKQVLQKHDVFERLLKWVVELSQFDIRFHTRTAIKGHALANFIAEFTYHPQEESTTYLNRSCKLMVLLMKMDQRRE